MAMDDMTVHCLDYGAWTASEDEMNLMHRCERLQTDMHAIPSRSERAGSPPLIRHVH